MRLTFLGSGGAFTDYRVNYQNNAVIETDEGLVLIDCGNTAVQSMRELGLSVHDVRAVLFTHLHGDHASPEQLLWERYYTPRQPGGESAFLSTELVAPPDILHPLKQALDPYMDVFTDPRGNIRTGGYEAVVRPNMTWSTEIAGLKINFFKVPHVQGVNVEKAAYGISIYDGKSRIVWSGDTTLSTNWLAAVVADPLVTRIFHECTFTPPYRGTVHTHWSQLSELPDDYLDRMTLMHHTEVPKGVDISRVRGAAERHQTFEL